MHTVTLWENVKRCEGSVSFAACHSKWGPFSNGSVISYVVVLKASCIFLKTVLIIHGCSDSELY